MTDKSTDRATFATRLGVIAATVGSAVGLGNIWRFPYEAGTHGGGAFMLCYIFFIIALGIPVICAEFVIGRRSKSNEINAFRTLAPGTKWWFVGLLGIVASVMILSFYSVVAGWTIEYFYQSAIGALDLPSQQAYHEQFDHFSTGNWRPVLWTLIFLAINHAVITRGVTKGIEKASNVMMPLLFLILVIFFVHSLLLPGAAEGLKFLFKPDFSKIDSAVLLGAMGQAFFSLSIGLGCMLTYGSYFNKETRIGRSATTTAALDTLVAIIAGVIIFPAVFTYGAEPAAGPTLVFEVLPDIFHHMPFGVLWSTLFFLLLFLASLSSTISMSEISISYLIEERRMSRRSATILITAVAMVFGVLCTLSFGLLSDARLFGMTIFDLFNYVSSNVLLPVGGMLISIFAGWVLDRKVLVDELTNYGQFRFRALRLIIFSLRYVAPIAIAIVLLNSIGLL